MSAAGKWCHRILFTVAAAAFIALMAYPIKASAATTILAPTDDARVAQITPDTNYGRASTLTSNGTLGANVESFIKFNVSDTAGVTSAKIRLFVTNGSIDGPAIFSADNNWGERTLTWNTKPIRTSAAIDDKGLISVNTWVEYDVSSIITGNGIYSFDLATSSTDGTDLSSKDATSNQPQLILESSPVGSAPSNITQPTILGQTQTGLNLTGYPGSWTGTQPITFNYQWRRCDSTGSSCNDISGATSATYQLTSDDVGFRDLLSITAQNSFGQLTVDSLPTDTVTAPPPSDPVLAGAGDIADCSSSNDEATAALLSIINPTRVIALGDNAYENGSPSDFANCYAPSWGAFLGITSPAVGNHEYQTADAAGYFGYFGPAAGDPTKGYYAYDIGAWRVYVLNSNCDFVPCSAGSAQEQWFQQDLAANHRSCKLVYLHHPRFASGSTPSRRNNTSESALYQDFYTAGGDLWLAGHEHQYERLAHLDPSGNIDTVRGVRNIIVGTGGETLGAANPPITGSEVLNSTTYGVIKLTLHPTGYDWQFIPIAGQTFTDSGSDVCHPSGITPPIEQTFISSADSRVTQTSPDTNYGKASSLTTDGGSDPAVESYLKFSVSGITAPITSAKIRIYSTSPTVDGPAIFATSTNWTEPTITWNTRPARTTGALADVGAIPTGVWTEYDVSSIVTSNGNYSFALATNSTDQVDFVSNNGTSTFRPQLVVTTSGG